MVDTPWRLVLSPNRGREYLALLSYLPLKGFRKMLTLQRQTGKVRAQLASTPGLVGYSFRAKLMSHRFWTLSIWEDERALTAFVASRMSHTRLNALTMMPSSFSSTSFFVQKNSDRFCTHSKYDTVTPPPLARMSGITRMPRLCKMSSASGVVGPFAPSATIFPLMRGAFSDVRMPSRAHGATMSTSSSMSASFVISRVPGNPTTLPVFSLNARTSFGSKPFFIEIVSMIHAIVWLSVYTSGAGMSFSGPMMIEISDAYRRVMRSSSSFDISFGLQITPPFAPPYGMPMTAHFQVIQHDRARTSSRETFQWYRMPPLKGPIASLYCTR